jgi:hypothetical protein
MALSLRLLLHTQPRPAPAQPWRNTDRALRDGLRGLEGGSSLARLLDAERGGRNVHDLPTLTDAGILRWAREHRNRTEEWPDENASPVEHAPGEDWKNTDMALR